MTLSKQSLSLQSFNALKNPCSHYVYTRIAKLNFNPKESNAARKKNISTTKIPGPSSSTRTRRAFFPERISPLVTHTHTHTMRNESSARREEPRESPTRTSSQNPSPTRARRAIYPRPAAIIAPKAKKPPAVFSGPRTEKSPRLFMAIYFLSLHPTHPIGIYIYILSIVVRKSMYTTQPRCACGRESRGRARKLW